MWSRAWGQVPIQRVGSWSLGWEIVGERGSQRCWWKPHPQRAGVSRCSPGARGRGRGQKSLRTTLGVGKPVKDSRTRRVEAERLPMGEFQERAWRGHWAVGSEWAVGSGESKRRPASREQLGLSGQAGLEEKPDQVQGPGSTLAPRPSSPTVRLWPPPCSLLPPQQGLTCFSKCLPSLLGHCLLCEYGGPSSPHFSGP